ncbi:GNAT family N-acetyltransferase [Sporosarcina saromensis]|uniref:GNAT family N-acetyltransferase n=1 Tax=Sporosarcina saromensis TaxID=359365 RepID=A0ABU4G901_9BACL|nr:GNAT family N-acetyltransferase [Sporosarcina saromensis]MDW0112810.1 GNAT family N-acetyltransferase [Sporosarcina saromensis]
MTELSIRKAEIHEAKHLSHLLSMCQWFTYEDLYSSAYIERLILKYYNVERIKQEITTTDRSWHGYVIAESRGKIVGAIGGGMIDETTGEIYVFYVDPKERGLGVGTRLLNFYTKLQKHLYGASEQKVAVAKGNKYGIPFYESRGFTFSHEDLAYGASEEEHDISLIYKRKI